MKDHKTPSTLKPVVWLLVLILLALQAGCSQTGVLPAKPTLPALAKEVVVYDWVEDIPDEVLQSFYQEYGVKVRYEVYESQEEAIENIRNGQQYDVVVMDDRLIPPLIDEKLIAKIDLEDISNIQNITDEFRHKPYDPQNGYSIPYSYGTVGLVVRADRVAGPIKSWNDLWNQQGSGKVILWRGFPRETVGMALKALGYSINSEDPGQLEQALSKLEELKQNVIFIEDFGPDTETVAPVMLKGYGIIAMGWSNDALTAQDEMQNIEYILPEEGTMLWGDNFVIPANSPSKETAQVFINFMLRPEISALVTNAKGYPSPNKAAMKYVNSELLNNPIVFPKDEDLHKGELIQALSAAGQELHDRIWQSFMDAP